MIERNIRLLCSVAGGRRRTAVIRHLLAAGIVLALTSGWARQQPADIKIGYLRLPETKATISLLDVPSRQ